MQLKQRIKKLENKNSNPNINPIQPKSQYELNAIKQANCEHPKNAVKFFRDYPATGYTDKRLVANFHCHGCGFQGNLWKTNLLTNEQIECFHYVQRDDFHEGMKLELELVEQGLLSYVFWDDLENLSDEIFNNNLYGFYSEIHKARLRNFVDWAFKKDGQNEHQK